jgi:hypothetical protein
VSLFLLLNSTDWNVIQGVSSTGAAQTIGAAGSGANITGVGGTSAAGTPVGAIFAAVSSATTIGQAGTLDSTDTIVLPGTFSTGQAGVPSIIDSTAIPGVLGNGQAQALGSTTAVVLPDRSSTGQAGTPGSSEFEGVTSASSIGTAGILVTVTSASVSGASCATQVGSFSAEDDVRFTGATANGQAAPVLTQAVTSVIVAGASCVAEAGAFATKGNTISGVAANGQVSPVLAQTPGSIESVTVALYNDNDGTPGDLIAVLGTVYDTDITGTQLVEFDASGINLDANTRYWIVLTGTSGTQIGWSRAATDVGSGVTPEYWVSLSAPISDYLLTENGDELLLEDGTPIGLQEAIPNAAGPSYQMAILAEGVNGVSANGLVGSFAIEVDVPFAGASAVGQAGIVTLPSEEAQATPAGVAATGATGTLRVELTAAFAGVQSTTAVGTITTEAISPTLGSVVGTSANGAAGTVQTIFSSQHAISGVVSEGQIGKLKARSGTLGRRSGRGAPRYTDPTPAELERRETEAEQLRRWRQKVDELLGLTPKEERDEPEEVTEESDQGFSFLASLNRPKPPLDEVEPEPVEPAEPPSIDKWRTIAEAEDVLLLGSMLGEPDRLTDDQLREMDDIMLLGDLLT